MAGEKRLIDANAADVNEINCYYGGNCRIEDVEEWLNEQPTVDAVEVVRCKDCEHCKDIHGFLFCSCDSKVLMNVIEPDDFCSYGERKDHGKT